MIHRMSVGLVVVSAMMLAIAGCNQPSKPPEAQRSVEKKYDLSITLDLRDAGGSEEYYVVERDGQLSFGGGMNARFERAKPAAMLSGDDMNALKQVIEHERLVSETLTSTHQPKDAYYRLDVKMDRRSVNKTVKGTNARIEPLRELLKEYANRRLIPELDLQPRPSAATQPAATGP